MASIDTGGGEHKKGKPQKQTLRVDFTPMVDMNMLLITFFMLCSTLAKPQVMDIAMPTDQKLDDQETPKVKESKAITLLLGGDDKVYYYLGILDEKAYGDYTTLKEVKYSDSDTNDGLRSLILDRNKEASDAIRQLKIDRKANKISEDQFKEQSNKIKGDKDALTVIIKPMPDSTYKNLVDALDEMQICSVGKYAIVELAAGDDFLLENYKTKGEYGKANLAPKK